MGPSRIPSVIQRDVGSSEEHCLGETPAKRTKLSGIAPRNAVRSMLRDVTNTVVRANTEPMRNNRYRYATDDTILLEEIKRKERKVLQDKLHFRNALLELEKESDLIRRQQLPNLRSAIAKKTNETEALDHGISQLCDELDIKNSECNLARQSEEHSVYNLQLKFMVEVQELENKLEQDIAEAKSHWEQELRQIEDMMPSAEMQSTMRQLSLDLDKVTTNWLSLKEDNDKKRAKYEHELQENFAKFQVEKESPMNELLKEQQELQLQLEELRSHKLDLTRKLDNFEHEYHNLDIQIKETIEDTERYKVLKSPLKEKLSKLNKGLSISMNKIASVEAVANKQRRTFDQVNMRLNQEKNIRFNLEYSIEESNGKARSYLIVSPETVRDVGARNYKLMKVTNKVVNQYSKESFQYNKIWSTGDFTTLDFFQGFFEPFLDMCLNKCLNLSLIEIADETKQENTSILRQLMRYVHSIYNERYQLRIHKIENCDELYDELEHNDMSAFHTFSNVVETDGQEFYDDGHADDFLVRCQLIEIESQDSVYLYCLNAHDHVSKHQLIKYMKGARDDSKQNRLFEFLCTKTKIGFLIQVQGFSEISLELLRIPQYCRMLQGAKRYEGTH